MEIIKETIILFYKKNMRLQVLLFVIYIFFFSTFSYGQKLTLELKNYTRKNGLPSNESYFILKDSKNFLWIATDEGVVRFNGIEMKRFELVDNVIFKIKEDEKGRIWFFSHSGKLSYYYNGIIHKYDYVDKIKDETKNLIITDANVFNDNILINSIHKFNFQIPKNRRIYSYKYSNINIEAPLLFDITKNKEIVFVQKLFGIDTIHKFLNIKLNGGSKISYTIPFNQKSFDHYGVIADKEILYFFNSNLVIKLYPDGFYKIKKMPSSILGINLGAQNNIWVSLLNNGAISVTKELDIVEHILAKYSVTSTACDYEGGTWFSTLEKGLFYLKSIAYKKYDGNEAISQIVLRTYPITDSSFLFVNHMGVFISTPSKTSLILNLKIQSISDLFIHHNKIIVAGNLEKEKKDYKKVYGEIFNTKLQLLEWVYFIVSTSEVFEKDKDIFFVGNGPIYNEIDINDHHEGFNNTPLFARKSILLESGKLYHDKKSQFWLGTTNSLFKFSTSLDCIKPFNENEPLLQKGVTNITQMDNGLYAIGIKFGGLVIMKDSTVLENITVSNGLSSNSIKYILPHKNYLWLYNSTGVSIVFFKSFSPLSYKVINVTNEKDFADINLNHLTFVGKNVLASTNNGIYSFNDSAIIAENGVIKPLPFYLSTISYKNIDTTGITSLVIPYNGARLNIGFNAISFANGDNIQYRYRILNNDTTWEDLFSPQLLLENLSSGNYKLQLQALIKNQHRFSEIKGLDITVEKPWWQNNYFRFLIVLLLVLTGYFFYKSKILYINAAAKKEVDIKSKFLELEQSALRSQMNPHFIFNCLSSVQQLILSGENEKANEYLVKFSRLMRLTLELSTSPYNTLADELNYLSEYILLEQLRFPNQFDFTININNSIDKQSLGIPNMMIQPIVENAINHGIRSIKNRLGFVSIDLHLEHDNIVCIVIDNGIGRHNTENINLEIKTHKSFAMDLIAKRLATFNIQKNNRNSIKIIDLKDGNNECIGTKVILYLPIKHYYDKSHSY